MSAPRAPALVTPELEIGCYRLHFSPASAVPPDRYTGSAWRGIFGFALHKLACTAREQECPKCLLYYTCVYSYLFETPPPPWAQKMRKYTAAPHPFVLAPAAEPSGEEYTLGLTLFGKANGMLAYVVQALARAARYGLRPLQAPLTLTGVDQQADLAKASWQPIMDEQGRLSPLPPQAPACPDPPSRARLVLITPLRLRIAEAYVRPEAFRFEHLFSSLLRRLSLLTYFHGSRPLETDFAALVARARTVRLQNVELRWQEWWRYSSRQKQRLLIGGLLGWFELETGSLGPLWPYLWLGQFTHAGKGATMGLGRYAVLPA